MDKTKPPIFVKIANGSYINYNNITAFKIGEEDIFNRQPEYYFIQVLYKLNHEDSFTSFLFIEGAEEGYKYSNREELSKYLDYCIECFSDCKLPDSIDKHIYYMNIFKEMRENFNSSSCDFIFIF